MMSCKPGQIQWYLPEELIFVILLWLPAKSLMRFKAVCKAWYALIRDPSFAQTHYANSQTRPCASHLLFHITNKILDPGSIHPASPNGAFSNQLPVHRFDAKGGAPLTSIVNGLICLWRRDGYRLDLLNLTTGEKIALPDPPDPSRAFRFKFLPSFQLGFDPIHNQYKVFYCSSMERNPFVLTLSSNMSWRKVEDVPLAKFSLSMNKYGSRNVCVDGSIFWSFERLIVDGQRVVQYFDLADEKFKLLSIHDQFGDGKFDSEFITNIGGKFTMAGLVKRFGGNVENHHNHESVGKITLWRLINKNDQVWVKSEIELPEEMVSFRHFNIVGTTNTGKVLIKAYPCLPRDLRKWAWGVLLFCDLRNRGNYETRKLRFEEIDYSAKIPPWPIGLNVSLHVENILPLHLLVQSGKPNL
ncbi:OLC1v1023926C1 [Oldenlandia corymbosa var. corymbosa]|uniref:OLC1v1023926C1 n=1 Tax=Oldenlandia corymbosa var. corymbosa TaxID=529605 RepID=A0AAV1C1V1_OLDCO|nr:OLC1v1023926C1 [Oldenlandia corymbosa var. corymbosa]